MSVLVIVYIVTLLAGFLLRGLNLHHLKKHGGEVPPGFEGAVDAALLARTSAYTLEQSRLGLVESLVHNSLVVVLSFCGLLGLYDHWIASFGYSFIVQGTLFFLGLSLAETLLGIPFSLYSTFGLEKRYGFNTMTMKLWLEDLAKSTGIGIILLLAMATGALALVQASPENWWLWVWFFFVGLTLFLMYISPTVIEPLFNKYEPLQADGLEQRIRAVVTKAGLQISKVLRVDASRRSRHSNAYFTGVGRVKRIVLYDTLLAQMSQDEIVAVLAHEVGHWKKGHVWKRLLFMEASSLAALYAAYRLLAWEGLPGMVGLPVASFPAEIVILGFLASIASFFFIPVSSWFSRRHEREADSFASEITRAPHALASALVKLSSDNLGNLHPHPMYASFYYSHPPVVERIRMLKEISARCSASPDHAL